MKLPKLYGLNKCSDMGPSIFVPSVFVSGCNLRCPYCMNSKLCVKGRETPKPISISEIEKYVFENKSKSIVISGGEPTLVNEGQLVNFLRLVTKWGCQVGISTNGTNPIVLRDILPFLSYVALDFKSNQKGYKELCPPKVNYRGIYRNVLKSLGILRKEFGRDDFDYEIRTTLYPPVVDKKVIRFIGNKLLGKERWVLQQFRLTKCMLRKKSYKVEPYSEIELEEILSEASKWVSDVDLRHV